ncbi:MAG TPA: A/G-specific adenine glycosylase [Candidatus Limnocylindria bacterium]|nr:A/G-specific adenine glycosylase [Candidatus Limnocylindria bacterium]
MPKAYTVSARLLAHYRRTARDLPWRRTHDPYEVLVSEVMLQQTQASRVTPAFERFIKRFPTLEALAAAPLGAVLREWSGLGYNRRARDLHRIARLSPDGLPRTVAELDALPGIGAYTAGAIASFAFGERVAFADVNIQRVLGRVFLGRPGTNTEAIDLDARAMPKRSSDLWHHALMDLGATLCKPRNPRCGACPLRSDCKASGSAGTAAAAARHHDRAIRPAAYPDTDRRVRGSIVRALTRADLTITALEQQIGDERVGRLTRALAAEGLVERAGRTYRLPS